MRTSTFSVNVAVAIALLMSLPAAGQSLTADVEVFYPMPASKPRGGGVATMGDSSMERLDAAKSPDGRALLRLAGDKAPVQGAWWFPNHARPTPEHLMIGGPLARLVFEVQATKPVKTELSVQWRVEGPAGPFEASGPIQVGPGDPTRVELPIPKLEAGATITGLVISFQQPGEYQIRRVALARLCSALVDPIEPGALRTANDVKLTGKAKAGVDSVTLRFQPSVEGAVAVEKTAAVQQGSYELPMAQKDLQAGLAYAITAEPAGKPDEAGPAQRLFVFPALTGKQCPPITRQGADLMRDGKRFGFVGVNYTPFLLGLSNRANFEQLAEDLLQMKSWGVRVARVTIDFGLVQPALGDMPDSDQYKPLMVKHGLDPQYVEQLDYFVALAGELGIYTVIDWHGMATDPYRYFLGGNETQKKAGEPGTAIAYLAKSNRERGEFDLSNPTHVEALCNAHRWIAKHYKGNPNLMGIEVPFNEPHTKYMAIESNWRRVTDLTAQAVAEGDPKRLTFALQPSYSHNNLLPSATWIKLDRVAGAGPHFYQANGPVPVRPDAKTMREPWLARESEGTFGWAFPAMLMPFSAVDYPLYNGESGAHGAEMVLPQLSYPDAARTLVEAQLVQEYASGMVGRMEWTMWRHPKVFVQLEEVYGTLFKRFSPVFEAGPRDRMKADLVFVQHPEAVKSSNGYNHACIPFAKAALDLHLPHVHYLTDDQFRHVAAAEMSVGLEQVVEAAEQLKYKAFVVDRRHLDPRVAAVLEQFKTPVLWLDRAEDLTAEQLAAFLEKSGIPSDSKTPRELQLIEGTEHLIVYRRLDGGANPAKAYPRLQREGVFTLVAEDGKTVFEGDAAALVQQGIDVDLPLWRSAIFRIVPR